MFHFRVLQTLDDTFHLRCSGALLTLDHVVLRRALMPTPNLPPDFDFTDPDIYCDRLPIDELAELRKTAPSGRNAQPEGKGGSNDGGFWVVTKHKDVKGVSRRRDVFSGLEKTALPRYKDGT